MPGYSGTPLPKKLGIKDGFRVALLHAPPDVKAELGDLLFSLVNVARLLEIDAEGSLRQAADTFTRRFKEVEAAMRAEGRQVAEASPEELDRQWLAVKSREGLERAGDGS